MHINMDSEAFLVGIWMKKSSWNVWNLTSSLTSLRVSNMNNKNSLKGLKWILSEINSYNMFSYFYYTLLFTPSSHLFLYLEETENWGMQEKGVGDGGTNHHSSPVSNFFRKDSTNNCKVSDVYHSDLWIPFSQTSIDLRFYNIVLLTSSWSE